MEGEVQSKCGWCLTHTLHDAYSFLRSLSHRGREGWGIGAIGDTRIDVIKVRGPVGNISMEDLPKIFPADQYHTYVAHNRYATKGREDRVLDDSHPHAIGGRIITSGNHILIRNCEAIAVHNGQADMGEGCDTPELLKYYLQQGIKALMQNIPGSYSMAIATKAKVLAFRDRYGVKPGCLGVKDGFHCAGSESIALTSNGATFLEDMEPGMVYEFSPRGLVTRERILDAQLRHCFFEWNYNAHLESILDGLAVRRVRTELGFALASEFNPANVDVITYLPRCPEVAGRSYAKASGKSHLFMDVFYKLKGERAFQGTTQADRANSIASNLFLLPRMESILNGKTITVVDDSTIRGTNSARARELLESCGVRGINYINYTPKIGIVGKDGVSRGCMFGVDMPPEDRFIVRTEDGRNRTDEEIDAALKMKVYFLSPEGMFSAFERAGMKRENLCSFCIGGKHPFS